MTPEQQEVYDERAAILEFDAGLSREEAEKAAASQLAPWFSPPRARWGDMVYTVLS